MIWTVPATMADAMRVLSGRLVFGDPQQICAVRFLAAVEECKDSIRAHHPEGPVPNEECPYCDGCGEHTCDCGDEHECRDCEGSGYTEGHACSCTEDFADHVVRAAVEALGIEEKIPQRAVQLPLAA
jgi:hypothetical protein